MHSFIKAGARDSLLSRAQVKEVEELLQKHYPLFQFDPLFLKTTGDKDLKTSLRALDKTDFFTKEIDDLLLQGHCDVGIHSAKDLPEPLPKGICIVAITKGMNPADALVFRSGMTLESLPHKAIVATSSERREQLVKELRDDLTFADLRGTIHQRLEKLESGEADAVVIAEAAIIRLGLTHLNRMLIPGETAPLQGKLAITAREDDKDMQAFFAVIDSGMR